MNVVSVKVRKENSKFQMSGVALAFLSAMQYPVDKRRCHYCYQHETSNFNILHRTIFLKVELDYFIAEECDVQDPRRPRQNQLQTNLGLFFEKSLTALEAI